MRAIVAGRHAFTKAVVNRATAREMFKNQPYKLELIADLPEGEEISTYTQDTFTDLCRGPHVPDTSDLKPDAFKLTSVAGAYWRGDEKNKMLQRIYGTAWESKADLDAHLKKLEEIEKRDHRRLGRELDLYSIHEEAGAGLIYWHPKGARVRLAIEDFWRSEHLKNGYELLYTPHIGKGWLWETSGHLGFYKQNMYAPAVHRRRGLLPEADELPVPPHDLQEPAALLPRPAPALGGAGHRVPLREVRACSTGSCASAASRRTTRTSSAPRSRSTTRSWRCSASP